MDRSVILPRHLSSHGKTGRSSRATNQTPTTLGPDQPAFVQERVTLFGLFVCMPKFSYSMVAKTVGFLRICGPFSLHRDGAQVQVRARRDPTKAQRHSLNVKLSVPSRAVALEGAA